MITKRGTHGSGFQHQDRDPHKQKRQHDPKHHHHRKHCSSRNPTTGASAGSCRCSFRRSFSVLVRYCHSPYSLCRYVELHLCTSMNQSNSSLSLVDPRFTQDLKLHYFTPRERVFLFVLGEEFEREKFICRIGKGVHGFGIFSFLFLF